MSGSGGIDPAQLGRFAAQADSALRAVMVVLRWAGRLIGLLAVVLLLAGAVDAALVATFAPVWAPIAVGVVVLVLVLGMVRYRSRLKWVQSQEQDVRALFGRGEGSFVNQGQQIGEQVAAVLPRLEAGSPISRLKALREMTSLAEAAQEGSPIGRAKDIAAALAGPSFGFTLYGMAATGVALGLLPVLAITALVA
jgi:predicted signal transduction protein with EAL and GGDEF domain